MGVPGNANALLLRSAAAAGGYQVSRSLRCNSADSAHLSRTPASAGNRKTWTWSAWVKRSGLGTGQTLFRGGAGTSNSTNVSLYFRDDNTIYFGGWNSNFIRTTAVFRDCSAWYHVLLSVDTTLSSNRIKLYVNSVEQAITQDGGYPAQNDDLGVNQAQLHTIGGNDAIGGYANFYLADVHFIDGQALTPSSFAETDATTGQWVPKAFSGSYGTNGFQLKFADNSNNTATTLGKDTSGNGNNWTPNNLSVTAGAGNDSLVDTPTSFGTDTGAGNEVKGNYCTWNPLDKSSNITLANGNLDASSTTNSWHSVRGTIGVNSGKYYWEITCNTTLSSIPTLMIGIGNFSMSLVSYIGASSDGKGYYALDGNKYPEATAYGASYTLNDVIGVALNMDAGTLTFYKNGVSQGQSHSGLTGTWFPALSIYGTASTTSNFGQRPFAYTAPSGFKALVDTNLPAPVVAQPSTVMDVKLYTGNGSTQTISGLGFSPDLVYVKARSASGTSPVMFDTVRGTSKRLRTNGTDAELDPGLYGNVSAFNSDGFTVAAYNGDATEVNTSSTTYVAWTWDAGSSTVTNTQGSITSSVRVNATAGFSIVSYTSNSSAVQTVGHGLNVAPKMIIWKDRDAATNWFVFHNGGTPYMFEGLNTTAAGSTSYANMNNTLPTSTVFTLNSGGYTINPAGSHAMIAYCFAPVAGYGNGLSYVGNGSTDGPFCYLGFLPKLILIKCSSTTGNWVLLDTSREGYNVDNDPLFPNLSDAEATTDLLDITSNGFKIRSTNADVNANAATYIVYAWASNPFQYSRAR